MTWLPKPIRSGHQGTKSRRLHVARLRFRFSGDKVSLLFVNLTSGQSRELEWLQPRPILDIQTRPSPSF